MGSIYKSCPNLPGLSIAFLGSVWQLHERNEGTRPSFILASSFTHETCSDFRRYALITSYLSPEVVIPKDKETRLERVLPLCANYAISSSSAVFYFPEVLVTLKQVLSVGGTVC